MYKKCYGLPAPAAAAKRLPLGALGTNTAEEPSPPAVRSDAQPAVQQAAQVAHSWLRSRAEKEIVYSSRFVRQRIAEERGK